MKLELILLNFLLEIVFTALVMRPTKELSNFKKTTQTEKTKSLNDMMRPVRTMTPTITTTTITRITKSKSYLERIREQIYRNGPTKSVKPRFRASSYNARTSPSGNASASQTAKNKRWRTTVTTKRTTSGVTANVVAQYECKFVLRNNIPYGSTCYPIMDMNKIELLQGDTTTSTAAPGAETLPTTTQPMAVHKECAHVAFCKQFKWK